MRRRLIKIVGEDAYKITISTYHGFGSEIIQRNPSYIDAIQNLRPIDALRADIIIRDIQKSLKYDSDFSYDNAVRKLRYLISDAKRATLTPEDLLKIVKANTDFISQVSKLTKPLTESLARISQKSLASFEQLFLPEVSTSSLQMASSL